MPDWFHWLSDGFMPHGYCLRWDVPLLSTLIIGNLGIALAYFQIPVALRYFVGKRKDLPYPHIFRLFAAFIFSCGLTHLIKVWTISWMQNDHLLRQFRSDRVRLARHNAGSLCSRVTCIHRIPPSSSAIDERLRVDFFTVRSEDAELTEPDAHVQDRVPILE